MGAGRRFLYLQLNGLAFGVVGFRLHVDIGVEHVGIIVQIVIFQDILVIAVIDDLDIHIIRVNRRRFDDFLHFLGQRRGALEARLLGRLLGRAFRADRRLLAEIEKPSPAGHAGVF